MEDVKQGKDLLDLTKNNPAFQMLKKLDKVDIRYGILLNVVILSVLKIPLISAGIYLNHTLILFGSFLMDVIIAALYITNWELQNSLTSKTETGFSTVPFWTGSLLGFVCSGSCGVITFRLIISLPPKARKSIITKTVEH